MESAIYIVATPIGNLSDITIRALQVLAEVDIIAAEDTRHTRKLLEHHNIRTKLISYHEHNELEKAQEIIELVSSGRSVALVSDAGTPLISDPGHTLVSLAKKSGVSVVPIPGASALLAALSSGGIACGKFIYEGFLPTKQKAKDDCLQKYKNEARTIVFYESPHRIMDTLEAICRHYPEREMVIARELTKRFETITKGVVKELVKFTCEDEDQQRGEFVLILSGVSDDEVLDSEVLLAQEKLLVRLLADLPPKKAVQVVCDIYPGDKRKLYEKAVAFKQS